MKRPLPEPPPEPRLDDAGGGFSSAGLAFTGGVGTGILCLSTLAFLMSCKLRREAITDGLCQISATSAMSADARVAAAPCPTAAARLASRDHTLSAIAAILIGSEGVSEVGGSTNKLLPGVPMILQEWLRG